MDRPITFDEVEALHGERTVCPTCGEPRFQRGPSGGDSTNYRCWNGHYWNVSPFGWDKLEAPDA